MVATRPTVPLERLSELLQAHWAVDASSLEALPSERDQNMRVDVGEPPRPRWVLKIANPAEDPAFLDAQEAVGLRLVAAGAPRRPVDPASERGWAGPRGDPAWAGTGPARELAGGPPAGDHAATAR